MSENSENSIEQRRRVILATGNQGKVKELRALLPPDIEIISTADLDIELPEETGSTFHENALIKARAAAHATELIAVADDSGLEVDALGGEPGIYSARYAVKAGGDATDEANNQLLLQNLSAVPHDKWTARFRSVVAVVAHTGEEHYAEGVVEGHIILIPRGENGFGYDPHFVPDGYARTMSELDLKTKNQISHRGQAFRKAAGFLSELLDR